MIRIAIVLLLSISCSSSVPVTQTTGGTPSSSIEEAFHLDQQQVAEMMNTAKTEASPPPKKAKAKAKTVKAATPLVQNQKKASLPSAPTMPTDYPESYHQLDVKSKPLWDQVKPPVRKGEKSTYSIRYFGVTVGDVVIENMGMTKVAERSAFYYQLRFKSASFYSSIYFLDDLLESYIDTQTLTPLKYSVRQREKKQDVDDLQLFSPSERKTYFWYRRLKKVDGSEKKKEAQAYTPRYFLDQFSGFHFIRGLPLRDLRSLEFPLVSRAELSLMQVRYLKDETIEIMGKDIPAVKIAVEVKLHDGLKKKGDLNFWYEAGGQNRLLKFEGKIKIGTVKGELVNYVPGMVEIK